MARYGHCEDCGSIMEAVGCPNCQELEVIQMIDSFPDELEVYEKYKG